MRFNKFLFFSSTITALVCSCGTSVNKEANSSEQIKHVDTRIGTEK